MALSLRWPPLIFCALQAHHLLILGNMPFQIAVRGTSPAAIVPCHLDRQMQFFIPNMHNVVMCTACHTFGERLVLNGLRAASFPAHILYNTIHDRMYLQML